MAARYATLQKLWNDTHDEQKLAQAVESTFGTQIDQMIQTHKNVPLNIKKNLLFEKISGRPRPLEQGEVRSGVSSAWLGFDPLTNPRLISGDITCRVRGRQELQRLIDLYNRRDYEAFADLLIGAEREFKTSLSGQTKTLAKDKTAAEIVPALLCFMQQWAADYRTLSEAERKCQDMLRRAGGGGGGGGAGGRGGGEAQAYQRQIADLQRQLQEMKETKQQMVGTLPTTLLQTTQQYSQRPRSPPLPPLSPLRGSFSSSSSPFSSIGLSAPSGAGGPPPLEGLEEGVLGKRRREEKKRPAPLGFGYAPALAGSYRGAQTLNEALNLYFQLPREAQTPQERQQLLLYWQEAIPYLGEEPSVKREVIKVEED